MVSQPTDIDHRPGSERIENSGDQLPADEIARRMERGLKRAFDRPPQPHGRKSYLPARTESKGAAREQGPRPQRGRRAAKFGAAAESHSLLKAGM